MSYDSVCFGFTCSIRSHPKYLDGESLDRLGAAVDWKETPEAHIFKVDLPGLTKKEVRVAIEGGVLKISGERRCEMVQDTDTWHSMERCTGLFRRRFRLPENAKMKNVRATMENGVLTVTVGKDESKKAKFKSIEISD